MRSTLAAVLLVALLAAPALAHRPPPRRKSPPPPPPPSPPPPPVGYLYPHQCSSNMGPAGDNTYISCTPYQVSFTGRTANTMSFAVASKGVANTAACVAANGRNCRSMNLGDVKFVINSVCRGSVQSISITDSKSTYTRSPVYAVDEYPLEPMESATTFRVVFPTAYTTSNVTGLKFTVKLAPQGANGCLNANTFFQTPRGYFGAQYAYFSADKKCCGTTVAAL